MVISSFLGVLLIAIPEAGVSAQGENSNGDMIVGTGYTGNFTIHTQGGITYRDDLTIRAGGMVQIINSSLTFSSSYSGATPVGAGVKALTLTIEDGGILILDNSTLTMDVGAGNVIPALGVVVRHGGYLESRTSHIAFSGHLLVDDARLDLIDSTVSGVRPEFNSTYFPPKVFSSSPVMLFMSSNVTMIGSQILDMYDNGTYNTALLAPYNNNYQFAKDTSSRQVVDYFLERDVNAAFGSGTTANITGQNPLSMTMNDTKNVTVAQGQRLTTTGFDMGGLVFEGADIQSVVLHVSYLTATNFLSGTADIFAYTPQFGAATPTTISITPTYDASNPSATNANVTKDFVLPLPNMSAQSLGKLALSYTNTKASNVYIDRIWLTVDMRLPTYRNITIGGSTNLVAADSFIPLNNINENNGTNAINGAYHKLVALDQSIANLYGLTVQSSVGGYTTTPVFKTNNHAIVIRPDAKGPSDTTGNSLSLLQTIDASYYTVGTGQVMQISHLNTGDLNGQTVNATIDLRYRTSIGYSNGGYVAYSFDGITYKNTNIQIVDRSVGDLTVSFSIPGKHTLADFSNLRIRYNNTSPSVGSVLFDAVWVDIRTEPTVALYRWAILNVTDSQSLLVGNVGVSSSIIGSGETAYYCDQTGAVATPPQAILEYLGKNESSFNRSGPSGFVKLPLLSDVLNSSNGRNGRAFDYDLVFQYRNIDGVFVLNAGNGGISTNFAHFPNMVKTTDVRYLTYPTLSIGLPDLDIVPSRISVNPAAPVTNSTVSILANIMNIGNDMGQSFVVSFYDGFQGQKSLIGNFTLPALRSGQTGVAFATWQHMLPGDHNITVVLNENNTLLEASKGNNVAGVIVKVMNYPDLVATNIQFKLSSSGSVVTQVFIGDSVTLSATVMNTGESIASDFLVRFWLGTASTGTRIGDVMVPILASGATADIQMSWVASVVQESGHNQSRMITVEVNPFNHANDTPIIEANYNQNVISGSILVIDNRADIWFPTGVSVKPSGGANTTSEAVQGQTIDISFTVSNEGLKPANGAVIDIYVKSDNVTQYLTSIARDLAGGESSQISFPWVVNVTAGLYSLVVEFNSRHVIEESNYTNNINSRVFTINTPNPLITINVGPKTDFQPGESILVNGQITNVNGNYALANQSITIRLLDSAGLPVGQAMATSTDGTGAYSGYVFVPTDRSGSHSVSVTLNTDVTYSAAIPINIVKIFNAQGIPLWMFALIAIIVIAIILVFSVYLYRYGLGKMVECGECGALIPESSKHCPRCGTEFETETAKCSECGTWIPAKSKECPECRAKFMTEPVEEISEDDYMSSMRRQYEEYINGFREQAKAALGKKYSEDKFMDWLKTEPAYLTFDAWVAKQEEGRKGGSVPCPACGTLNPKGAHICSKCGTVFDRVPEIAQIGEPADQAKPFRKIVKRSSDRKMVSKKADNQDQTKQAEPADQEQKKE